MTPEAARTFHTRKARTSLNLATGHLERAAHELERAGMAAQATAMHRVLVGAYELIQALGPHEQDPAVAGKRRGGGS